MVLDPKTSGKVIASLTESVKIKESGIEELGNVLIEQIESGRLNPENFSQNGFHPKPNNPQAIDWIFVVDTLNFCFWHLENELGWVVEGQTGYFALCVSINRAIKEGVAILNPQYYSSITELELAEILKSDNDVQAPLLKERVECLNEVGKVLIEKFGGSFKNCVIQAGNNAKTLLDIIVTNFKCFKDEAKFRDYTVTFYKRAQILIGDIWACFNNKGLGYFKDINEITMFADYRVPQVLLYYGVFEYSDDLYNKLSENQILINGEENEVSIRGCSIHAVELLKEYAEKKLKNKKINSILIDHFLWDFRRLHAREIERLQLPFHKTLSIYY